MELKTIPNKHFLKKARAHTQTFLSVPKDEWKFYDA